MRSMLALFTRTAFVLAILIGLVLAVARTIPAEEADPKFQVQVDAEIMPPTRAPSSPSPVEIGDHEHHQGWRKLFHDTWDALTVPANNARASMHSRRRGRYFRRARAHP
ncbi:hypothetical protein ACEPAF_2918 [Sanghuangporus sanghuang]